MDAAVFEKFRTLVYEHAGIDLRAGKEAMLQARLSKRIRQLGLESEKDYLNFLYADATGQELIRFLDVVSTNFTSFFRENDHFDFMKTAIGQWIAAGQQRFRFWSCASSTGEEPYSIVISMEEAIADRPIEYRLLATDISTRVLEKANAGIYRQETLSKVSKPNLVKFFDRIKDQKQDSIRFQVKDRYKEKILYKRLNLSTPPFPMKGPLDIVFCRNVMIYFDNRVRQNLIQEVERLLKPGGYLFIGHTETLTGIATGLKMVRASIYRKGIE